jgi:flagellar FliL protein
MLSKIPKKLIMIVGPLVVGALLFFFVVPMIFGDAVSIQIGSAKPAGGEPTVVVVEKEANPIPYPLDERVLNLADPGGYRYLKVQVVLELEGGEIEIAAHSSGGGGGHGGGAAEETTPLQNAQKELTSVLEPVMPRVQDIMTSVLTSKSVSEVSTAAGKEAVKAELIEKLGPLFEEQHHPILAVYFSQFLIQ